MHYYLFSIILLAGLLGCSRNEEPSITKIAFGSCADQDEPQPILEKISSLNPDLFIYLGDNIYGDSRDMEVLKAKYQKLEAKPEFQKLRATAKVLATWDDHDYGENDAGRHYPFKEASKEIFLDFWKEPMDSERRKHKGIYHSQMFGPKGKRVQIIILDTRTFRDDLHGVRDTILYKNDYQPNLNPDSTMLGREQWAWLEQTFKEPANLRIIASSNQFAHEYNGWESWTNVPNEQQRMIDLIKETKANGVVFISGDVHWGEISKMNIDDQYPIYDITSSGITQDWDSVEPNKNRVGDVIRDNNVGMIEIDWKNDPALSFTIYDVSLKKRVQHQVKIEEISF